jgi:ABC-type multidrug transport system fused ATPase/permease subunit
MSTILTAPLAVIGRSVLGLLAGTGRVALYFATLLSHLFRPPWYPRELAHQLLHIGWLSLPVVGLTALFTGGALALQIYAGGSRFNAEAVVPQIVAIGITRELGPVLGGLMVAGRVAAAIAAEIGTMKVTEQIDALVTLSTNPMKYLAVPRVLAATLSLPAAGRGRRQHRHLRRLPRRHHPARFRRGGLYRQHGGFPRDLGHRLGPGQGRGLRLYRGDHGLLPRHAQRTRRARRGAGDDQGRGLRLHPHPRRQLHPDGGLLLRMIRLDQVTKSFGPKEVLRGIDLTVETGESLVVIGGSGTGSPSF